MKKINFFNLSIGAVAILLIILSVIGAFFDLEISSNLYAGMLPSENFFGVLFAFIGIIPTFVGWSFLGASLLFLARHSGFNSTKSRWLIALAILLFVLSFFFFCNTLFLVNENAFYVHYLIAYPIGIAVISFAAYLGYSLTKRSKNPKLLKTVLLLIAVSILTMLIIMVTKEIMNRPRFRFVFETGNEEFFKSFWESGADIKESFSSDALSDEFSSFPSGHSAYSMFAIFIFPALSDFCERLKSLRIPLFFAGLIWWALTALSRISVGAHYLSDVSIAGLVTIFSYSAVSLVGIYIKKKSNHNSKPLINERT